MYATVCEPAKLHSCTIVHLQIIECDANKNSNCISRQEDTYTCDDIPVRRKPVRITYTGDKLSNKLFSLSFAPSSFLLLSYIDMYIVGQAIISLIIFEAAILQCSSRPALSLSVDPAVDVGPLGPNLYSRRSDLDEAELVGRHS